MKAGQAGYPAQAGVLLRRAKGDSTKFDIIPPGMPRPDKLHQASGGRTRLEQVPRRPVADLSWEAEMLP